jgi:hypothetical protein
MASSFNSNVRAIQKLIQQSPVLKRGAEYARQEIFGHVPQLNMQTGNTTAKKSFTGPYLEKYYPISINTYARKVRGRVQLAMMVITMMTVTLDLFVFCCAIFHSKHFSFFK